MRKRIVLISCVSKKLPHSAEVKNLYISTLFKFNLKYANTLGADSIYILSAKHGLISLNEEIEPYELTLNNMPSNEIKEWANKVKQQLTAITLLEEDEFIFLAGDKYRKYLLPHIKHVQIPFEGLRIGKQLQKLKVLTS